MTKMPIRDVSLYVRVIGRGTPLALMHGGPGLDYTTMLPFKPCAEQNTLIFYDHRCNGRSTGADVSSMTWDNLTADAEALRQALGFEKWAVLGHSFGGMVALEYALRYPDSLSHLLLIDSCGDIRWAQENAPRVLAERGYGAETVESVRRFFNGELAPREVIPAIAKFAGAYHHHLSPWQLIRILPAGLRMKSRPETATYAYRHLLRGWTVMDRLGEIQTPTLVAAGRYDFLFPPEHQEALAAGIPNARLAIIDEAGHDVHVDRGSETLALIREFLSTGPAEETR
jgi:proline iminopeptidase